MSIGVLLHNLVILIVCLIWFRSLSAVLGVVLGAAAAVLLLASMAYSTELCVEAADEEYARKKMTVHTLVRNLSVIILVILLWKFTEVNILVMVLGILGLKTGAYLYPVFEKIFGHKAERE
jgi:hypothetical protein